jgi:hypothetical protein
MVPELSGSLLLMCDCRRSGDQTRLSVCLSVTTMMTDGSQSTFIAVHRSVGSNADRRGIQQEPPQATACFGCTSAFLRRSTVPNAAEPIRSVRDSRHDRSMSGAIRQQLQWGRRLRSRPVQSPQTEQQTPAAGRPTNLKSGRGMMAMLVAVAGTLRLGDPALLLLLLQ